MQTSSRKEKIPDFVVGRQGGNEQGVVCVRAS
jgi:hypothetical protein